MDFKGFYYLNEVSNTDLIELRTKFWPEISKLFKEDLNVQGEVQSDIIELKKVPMTGGTFKLRVAKEGLQRTVAAKELENKINKIRGLKAKPAAAGPGSNAPWLIISANIGGSEVEIFRFEFKHHPGERVGGADYEPAIVNGWNEITRTKAPRLEAKPETKETGLKIAKYLKSNIIKDNGPGIKIGSETLGVKALSDFWIANSEKPDSTPKTDFILSGRKISLKMGDSAQLASGKVIASDGSALVLNALDNSKVKPALKGKIVDMVSRRNRRISGDKKTYMAMKWSDILEFGKEYFRGYHRELTDLLREVASKDPNFAIALAYEAMIGEKKFNEEIGRADFLLAASEDGSIIKFHSKDDDAYIRKIASQIDINVNFKSSRGSAYSALRIASRKLLGNSTEINFGEVLAEAFEIAAIDLGIDCKVLNEGILDWVTKIFNIIKEALQKGIDKLLTLFGLSIESVQINDDSVNFLE